MNESPYDGQWRQLAWLLVGRGARLVEYWHWNTLPFGTETYWGGVLPHSGIPDHAYQEIARIGQELRAAGGAFAAGEPDYDIAVLYDSDSKFALSTQGYGTAGVTAMPGDQNAYAPMIGHRPLPAPTGFPRSNDPGG